MISISWKISNNNETKHCKYYKGYKSSSYSKNNNIVLSWISNLRHIYSYRNIIIWPLL